MIVGKSKEKPLSMYITVDRFGHFGVLVIKMVNVASELY